MTSSDQATGLMTDLVTHDVIARFVYIKECLLREMNKFFQGDFITYGSERLRLALPPFF
jgi:hypothetical protein